MFINSYPTKEEILRAIQRNPPQEKYIAILTEWKKYIWKRTGHSPTATLEKFNALLFFLSKMDGNTVLLKYVPDAPSPHYNRLERTIIMDRSFSLISLLHEYGHHLYGAAELDACAFSIGLFQKVFPKAFAKLNWKGHLLVRQKRKRKIPS